MPLLKLVDLSKYFGGLKAVNKINLAIEPGEIRGLMGPNGAGKTTLFNLITGFVRASAGEVIFKGKRITSMPPNRIAKMGIVRTFQLTELFKELTVLENVDIACHLHTGMGLWGQFWRPRSIRKKENAVSDKSMELLNFVGLADMHDAIAGDIPHGFQRKLGVAVALAADPELLLLDEPATGMNPVEAINMMAIIRKIRDRGVTIFIVEHNMKFVMDICDQITAINFGEKIAEAAPQDIVTNTIVLEAYLGKEEIYA